MRITDQQFFSNYMFHPLSKDLDTGAKCKTLIKSIALGIFTLGICHLACAIKYRNRSFSVKDPTGREQASTKIAAVGEAGKIPSKMVVYVIGEESRDMLEDVKKLYPQMELLPVNITPNRSGVDLLKQTEKTAKGNPSRLFLMDASYFARAEPLAPYRFVFESKPSLFILAGSDEEQVKFGVKELPSQWPKVKAWCGLVKSPSSPTHFIDDGKIVLDKFMKGGA